MVLVSRENVLFIQPVWKMGAFSVAKKYDETGPSSEGS